MSKTTEKDSHYRHLEKMTTAELLININKEDQTVANAVENCIPQIEAFVNALYSRMIEGGRLFYIGAGTSGRLGIVDASECPPTFGVPHGMVIGIIAGGDGAIRKAVEFAEDDRHQGYKDLEAYEIKSLDTVVGIAASGSTPYVVGALRDCQQNGIATACITNNPGSDITRYADHRIECEVGPEFVTGSTRMKSGTSQKLILNMITTSVMIKLGRVRDNKMVDMQLSNNKLIDRGIRMLVEKLDINQELARKLLDDHGSVRAAIDHYIQK